MKITNDFKNGLLKRREITFSFNAEKNPGIVNSTKMIGDHFKSAEDVIVVKDISSFFGSDEFIVRAFIYDSKDAREMIEQKKRVKAKVEA